MYSSSLPKSFCPQGHPHPYKMQPIWSWCHPWFLSASYLTSNLSANPRALFEIHPESGNCLPPATILVKSPSSLTQLIYYLLTGLPAPVPVTVSLFSLNIHVGPSTRESNVSLFCSSAVILTIDPDWCSWLAQAQLLLPLSPSSPHSSPRSPTWPLCSSLNIQVHFCVWLLALLFLCLECSSRYLHTLFYHLILIWAQM